MITVTEYTWHHTAGCPAEIYEGMTIRECLKALRDAKRWSFDDLGGATIRLSDGTWIDVELTPASDGGYLIASQRITRKRWSEPYESGNEYTIRHYDW